MSDHMPATDDQKKPPMRLRRVRIAASVFFALLAGALCILWFSSSQGTDAKIRPGFGIPICHVGMPGDKLSHWDTPPEDFLSDSRHSSNLGIEAQIEDGKVASAWFHYISKDHSPYRGETDVGISSRSSIEDVLSRYGDPSYVWRSEQSEFGSFPGGINLAINYVEEGIVFQFLDNRLMYIQVFAPNTNFDYESMRALGASCDIYIRDSVAIKRGEELQRLAKRLELAAE